MIAFLKPNYYEGTSGSLVFAPFFCEGSAGAELTRDRTC
jgi:hypothetical protein